jgi:hypothetical protein
VKNILFKKSGVLNLNSFSSFFEIFFILNISFTGYEKLRELILTRILRAGSINSEATKIENPSKDSLLSEETKDKEVFDSKLDFVWDVLKRSNKALKLQKTSSLVFINFFQPMSLLIGLLCLYTIIIGGIQNQQPPIEVNPFWYKQVFSMSCAFSVFSYCIFFSTFFKKALNISEVKIKSFQVLLFFVLTLLLIISLNKINLDEYVNNVILISFAYLIYFYFVIINVKRLRKYKSLKRRHIFFQLVRYLFGLKSKKEKSDKKMIGIDQRNTPQKLFLKFNLVLILISIPLIYYLFKTNGLFTTTFEYVVILITPIFPYILLGIRAFYNRRYFKKRDEEIVSIYWKQVEQIKSVQNLKG